jgi:hypothetical protein
VVVVVVVVLLLLLVGLIVDLLPSMMMRGRQRWRGYFVAAVQITKDRPSSGSGKDADSSFLPSCDLLCVSGACGCQWCEGGELQDA